MIYVNNDCLSPYFNLALEEYLFEQCDCSNFYFCLWQNDNTIVIGRNQNVYDEIDLEYVTQNNIRLARRMTGGGAVYHDLGNINFTFILPDTGGKNYDFKKFTDPIAKVLLRFGVKAEHSGRNDLLINGRKFSGSARYMSKNKIIHHGTLMFSSDLDVIQKCLTPSEVKLASHGVSSAKSRVTTIYEHLEEKISLETFKKQFLNYIFEEYEDVTVYGLSDNDISSVQQLSDKKYSAKEWIYGDLPVFNVSGTKRFEGCGSINISMNIKSGKIEYCKISGDFFGNGDLADIEGRLQNIGYGKEFVKAALIGADIGYYFNHLTLDRFLELF